MSNRPNCVCSLWASLVLLGFGSVGWGQIITTVAGNGLEGYAGDGGPASQAQLNNPWSMAVDEAGNLYIADTHNYRIRRVDGVTGVITTVAGTGDRDYAGDGGPASQAQLNNPWSVAVDGTGNLYIASGVRIRRVDATTGIITTVAGTAVPGFSGDGGPATDAQLNGPSDVAVDGAGHLYIADGGNYRIRRVDGVTGVITTVAGTGDRDYAGDGGPATQAQIWPIGVAVDGAGHLYIADGGNYRIRRVDGVTGVITTVAGTGEQSLSGDDGPATMAQLLSPKDVAFDPAGHLYIADGFSIRRVDRGTGVITTVAGTDTWGDAGDVGPATQARLNTPNGVAINGAGHLYIADTNNHRIRKVTALSVGLSLTQLNFGAVPAGQSKVLTFTLYNYGSQPLTVGDMLSSHPDVRVGSTPFWLAAQDRQEVVVTFTPRSKDLGIASLTSMVSDGVHRAQISLSLVGMMAKAGPNEAITFELVDGAPMEFVWVEPGTFLMGTPDARRNDYDEDSKPVLLSQGFYLGKFELTQHQWVSIMDTQPWRGQEGVLEDPDAPATNMSWQDMQEFLALLNDVHGETIYRLPTEAEWEYACRAGTTTRWSCGEARSCLDAHAWYGDNACGVEECYAHVVGTKLPNPWGFHDMHGNAWEWVQDWYSNTYSTAPLIDPQGRTFGTHRTGRGGSFGHSAMDVGSATMGAFIPDSRQDGLGARLVRIGPKVTPPLVGDFDGNGQLTVDDFFLFVDHFGSWVGAVHWDPRYDLVPDGVVRFDDFFQLADQFASEEQAKLLALARQYLGLPAIFSLEQNHPNPFNSRTVLRFTLPRSGPATLAIYNLAGQRVTTLADGLRQAGTYTVAWDGRDAQGQALASGVYLYRLQAGAQVETRKLLLLR